MSSDTALASGSDGAVAMSDPVGTFRRSLLDAGLLIDLGVPGLYGRSATFESIALAVSAAVVARGADQLAQAWRFPAIFPRDAFERSGYLRSFPDLIGAVEVFAGNERQHNELLNRLQSGADWTTALQPADVALCSAACHPLYPIVEKKLPAGGKRYDVLGLVYRNEPSPDPARMQTFRQHEFVYIGNPAEAVVHRDRWLDRGTDLLESFGLNVTRVVANDPFFGRAGKLLANSQRSEVLKYELVATVSDEARPTAIASSNLHQEHFGVAFGLRTADGAVAHSACVGFGLERIALALVRAHGVEPLAWPSSVRSALWP